MLKRARIMQMAVTSAETDSGLDSLTLLLHFHGIAADAVQIRHRFGATRVGIAEILLCAREFKLKSRVVTSGWERLPKLPLPAIVERSDGSFAILAKIAQEKALLQPPTGVPMLMGRDEFEGQWTGRLILM